MALFDVSKYEVPKPNDVNMERTKYNVGVFLSAYLTARARCAEPREPKITTTFSLVPPSFSNQNSSSVEDVVIQNEEAKQELLYLHNLFSKGFATIQHPFNSEISDRRKKVFYDRFIRGQSVYIVSQRNHISEETVKEDTSTAIVQFASALELVEFR